jgi:NAD+ kinase
VVVVNPVVNPSSSSIALYRGRFDPPGLHHVAVVRALLARFDRVVIVPWGAVAERAVDENVSAVYRARLIDLAFGRLDPRVTVDLRDLENLTVTTSASLDQELSSGGERVFHVIEHDSFAEDRRRLHERAALAIVAPEGAKVVGADGAVVITVGSDVAGRVMRHRIFEGEDIDDLVPEAVAADIRRRGLYRSIEPRAQTRLRLSSSAKVFISKDDRNPRAHALAERLRPFVTTDLTEASAIVVIGGDGSMLHAIQTHWRRRLPFLGINAGHIGFLLNDAKTALPEWPIAAAAGAGGASAGALGAAFGDAGSSLAAATSSLLFSAAERLLTAELVVHHLPMLHVELLGKDGRWTSGLTFNDAWVERSSGQSAWVEITVDGRVRLEKLVCDGVLVSTAAGSTAYARSMGASPLLADTPAWLLVGSNVMDPIRWKSALLAKNSVVEVRSLHVDKRPLAGFLHGVSMGEVTMLRARLSRAASAELCFLGLNDLTEKIARVQFPRAGELS